MTISRIFKVICVGSALLSLVACEHTVVRQSATVQETVAKRSGVRMQIHASNKINQDASGRARPVRVKVYQLSNRDSFVRTSMNEFANRDFLALGDALVRQTEVTVKPGQTVNLALDQNITGRYVGVVAFFANPAGENWRVVKAVNSDVMQVSVQDNQIVLR